MPKYFGFILLIILYIIFHVLLNINVQKNGNQFYLNREKNNKTRSKVFDILHKYIPENENLEWVTHIILCIMILPLFIKNDSQLYFDLVILLILINLIRDITINLTILPKNKTCKIEHPTNIPQHIVGSCYDKIFSGHFAFVFILSLLYYSNSLITSIPLLVCINLINSYFLLLSRSHYTIDIVVSFFVVYLVYTHYSKTNHSIDHVLNLINSKIK